MIEALRAALAAHPPGPGPRVWRYLPYDQLSMAFLTVPAERAGVVLVESAAKAGRRPYHRQKLALLLANQRHFAVELARAGVAVRYVATRGDFASALSRAAAELGPLTLAEPAERELRAELAGLVAAGALQIDRHPGWLTRAEDAPPGPDGRWRLDTFYRQVRQRTGLLMVDGAPEGGRYSFDADNRQPWSGAPPAPEPPRFVPDAITAEVIALVEDRFAAHPGRVDAGALPATAEDAERSWAWALAACLPHFGPYEDAMSARSRGLFHTRVSPLLNLHRLLPARVVGDVARAELPLACREGFVRQVLGWRELVHHVHVATDGLRDRGPIAEAPGDGGWSAAHGEAWPASPAPDGGAAPSLLGAALPVPPALWGRPSGLRCLDEVVRSVWDEGWSHHITRLMVIGNLMTLLGVSPRALADWFWVAYVDAYDWVVEPNVLAMATFGTDRLTTKPYVSGAAYLARMGDYCRGCRFDPKRDCPVTPMYWAFLAEHAALLGRNPRVSGPVASALRRDQATRARDRQVLERVRARLLAGEVVEGGGLFG